ncbi:hypothetical protein DL93DRAFT_2088648 [Clavulina sp. PMI_390]|nr:hypothetical protein DL93DRAFT_2088648 [Clavulina sp. PMI_390]
MSSSSGSIWATFAPTPQELAYVQLLFNAADPQKLGIITGEAAVTIFAGSELPPDKLGEVWAIADHDNNGFLPKKGVAAAVRLIAWAQLGEPVTEALLNKAGAPLPTIKGIQGPNDPPRVASPIQRNITGSSSFGLPPFNPADRAKFLRLFAGGGPVGGLLSGEKARDIFIKSRLPVEKLGQIWMLADTKNRGALDTTDFAIGMHLIQAAMSSPSFNIPSTLPPGFYESVSGGPPSSSAPGIKPLELIKPLEAQSTGGSIPLSPTRAGTLPPPPSAPTAGLRAQLTGGDRTSAYIPNVPLRPQTTGSTSTPLSSQLTGTGSVSGRSSAFPSTAPTSAFSTTSNSNILPWDIKADEKAKADGFFSTLDTAGRGYIEGDVAVPFMLESHLEETVLAQIWDLADINNDGKLTRDGFAVALHLITNKLAGKEVPTVLPPSLVPPSMRKPAAAPVSQIHKDLWDLEDDLPVATPTPPPARAMSPGLAAPLSPMSTGAGSGRTVTPQFAPPPAARSPPPAAPVRRAPTRDIFDDEDDETASAEAAAASAATTSLAIANTTNHLTSTQRSLATTTAERTKLQASAADAAAQLSQLESQLASAKAQHETETRLVGELGKRQAEQVALMSTTRAELVTAESDLSALRASKAEVEGAVLRDKEEIRGLQKQLKEVGEASAEIKAEVEKMKKEARQVKGMVAIARKQLSTAEENLEKAKREREEVEREVQAANEELQAAEADTERLTKEAEAIAALPHPAASPAPAPAADKGIEGAAALAGAAAIGGGAAALGFDAAFGTSDPAVAFPASVPLPETPDVQSPVGVMSPAAKSNNPFGRLTRQNSVASSITSNSAIGKPFGSQILPAAPLPPTPVVEAGEGEAEVAEAAIAAPLPASAPLEPFVAANVEGGAKPAAGDDPFNAAFGIEEPTSPASPPPPPAAGEAAEPQPAVKEAEPRASSSGPPPGLVAEEDDDVPSQLAYDASVTAFAPAPAPATTSAPPAPAAEINDEDDSSDDEEFHSPEDAFGSKPPLSRSPAPRAADDLFGDSPFSPPSTSSAFEAPKPAAAAATSDSPAIPAAPPVVTNGNGSAFSAGSAFDDAFGMGSSPVPAVVEPAAAPAAVSAPAPAANASSAFSSFLPPPPSAKETRGSSPFSTSAARFPALANVERPVSTVDFDDAFGSAPTGGAAAPAAVNGQESFSGFQNSFDDAFDFGGGAPAAPAASAPTTNGHTSPPAPAPAPAASPASAWPAAPAPTNLAAAVPAPAPAPAARQNLFAPPSGPPPPANESAMSPVSFDDAFGAPPAANELPASSRYAPPAHIAAPSPRTPVTAGTMRSQQHEEEEDEDNRPLAQTLERRGTLRRSISPPILRSRMSISPPPQATGKSSKGNKDESGGGKSKLSLNLFGRNKKLGANGALSQPPLRNMPPPHGSSLGSPTRDCDCAPPRHPRNAGRGGEGGGVDVIGSVDADGDIQAVTSITAMGFTREQAVEALELSNYDVREAVNKLVGVS